MGLDRTRLLTVADDLSAIGGAEIAQLRVTEVLASTGGGVGGVGAPRRTADLPARSRRSSRRHAGVTPQAGPDSSPSPPAPAVSSAWLVEPSDSQGRRRDRPLGG